MGKKKFIDNKKYAKFRLMDRDSGDNNTEGNDRVFVRVDDNYEYSVDAFDDESIFADAPEDMGGSSNSLPEHVRKEILELGFPDDGYNYLIHLREIRSNGNYVPVAEPRLDLVQRDVKAYDASRVQVTAASDDFSDTSIFNVASRTTNVKAQRVVDPEVAALLDASDELRFGSDVDELEEDFVVQANFPAEREAAGEPEDYNVAEGKYAGHEQKNIQVERREDYDDEKPRVRRLLDEQFDLLEHQEYGTDEEDDYGADYVDEEADSLADKLKHAFNDKMIDNLDLDENYKAPADLLNNEEKQPSKELTDVVRKCVEYAKKYENEDENNDMVVVEESSDESEVWDCETIVSTYSNLDNHPGKIGGPEVGRRKKMSEAVSGALNGSNHVISLRGKEKLPVDYLPHNRKAATEKVKEKDSTKAEQQKRKQHGQESKEEKKERKAAIKEQRRAARLMKKEVKGLYQSEKQRALKVAADSGPSSIRLM